MEKRELKILVVDRQLKQGEKVLRDIFDVYKEKGDDKGYNIVVFPYRKDKAYTEVVIFSYSIYDDIRFYFKIPKNCGEDDTLYDFDLEGITEQTFFDILDSYGHEVITDNLTDVENGV